MDKETENLAGEKQFAPQERIQERIVDDSIVLPVKLEPREQDVPAASQERIQERIVGDTIDVEIINGGVDQTYGHVQAEAAE